MKKLVKIVAGVMLAGLISFAGMSVKAEAQMYVLPDGTVFDSDFYANLYPEMRGAYANGANPERLLYHYLTYGIAEGRIPSLYSMYYPTAATQVTANVYPAGICNVVPVQYLYPYGINQYVTNLYSMYPYGVYPYGVYPYLTVR